MIKFVWSNKAGEFSLGKIHPFFEEYGKIISIMNSDLGRFTIVFEDSKDKISLFDIYLVGYCD